MKKIIAIAAGAALALSIPTLAHATEFDGVTTWTPGIEKTCDEVSFSHPAFKSAFGIADKYGVRFGETQAEAQAKAFEPYLPGSSVTVEFEDRYTENPYYFELKVGFPGKEALIQQVGQIRGLSEACELPVVEEPEDLEEPAEQPTTLEQAPAKQPVAPLRAETAAR